MQSTLESSPPIEPQSPPLLQPGDAPPEATLSHALPPDTVVEDAAPLSAVASGSLAAVSIPVPSETADITPAIVEAALPPTGIEVTEKKSDAPPAAPLSEAQAPEALPEKPKAKSPPHSSKLNGSSPAASVAKSAAAPTVPVQVAPAAAKPVGPIARPAVVAPVATVVADIQRPWLRWAGYVALGLVSAVGGGVYGTYASWRGSEFIAPRIFIQGEPVGGLTRHEARQRLEQRFGRLFVTFETTDRPFKLGLGELGGRLQFDRAIDKAHAHGRIGSPVSNLWQLFESQREDRRLSLPVEWDKDVLRSKMWVVATQYNLEPKDATLRVGARGIEVVPHQTGRSINVGATLEKLQKVYYAGLPRSEAMVRTEIPRLTSADLAGVDVKLGSYRTTFDTGIRGRSKNIKIAAGALDGRLLMPGEMFSFNDATGERTSSKGYRIAHIFVHKRGEEKAEVVDGLGGGVCQVSSTLFNAVRRANKKTGKQLSILELNHHSLPVSYVPGGLDATVAWPHKDFKFRNKFAYPIYLRATVDGSRLNISVWGRVPDANTAISTTQATRLTLEDSSST